MIRALILALIFATPAHAGGLGSAPPPPRPAYAPLMEPAPVPLADPCRVWAVRPNVFDDCGSDDVQAPEPERPEPEKPDDKPDEPDGGPCKGAIGPRKPGC